MVLFDAEDDDFVAAPITSRPRDSNCDVPIQLWRDAGLNAPSTTRVHKLTVLAKDEVLRRLGELDERDNIAVADVVRRAFSLS